jgi:hypothetical protein
VRMPDVRVISNDLTASIRRAAARSYRHAATIRDERQTRGPPDT